MALQCQTKSFLCAERQREDALYDGAEAKIVDYAIPGKGLRFMHRSNKMPLFFVYERDLAEREKVTKNLPFFDIPTRMLRLSSRQSKVPQSPAHPFVTRVDQSSKGFTKGTKL